MKHTTLCLVLVSISCALSPGFGGGKEDKEKDWISLFNGKDLDGWVGSV